MGIRGLLDIRRVLGRHHIFSHPYLCAFGPYLAPYLWAAYLHLLYPFFCFAYIGTYIGVAYLCPSLGVSYSDPSLGVAYLCPSLGLSFLDPSGSIAYLRLSFLDPSDGIAYLRLSFLDPSDGIAYLRLSFLDLSFLDPSGSIAFLGRFGPYLCGTVRGALFLLRPAYVLILGPSP